MAAWQASALHSLLVLLSLSYGLELPFHCRLSPLTVQPAEPFTSSFTTSTTLGRIGWCSLIVVVSV